ncbi:hypothetical protein [Haloarchaeobius sp. DYHT-AS-18]|uniref:hypothetical protein n=1 Tax=Haloarchaeobius sp. DYHT-AS-18 TaxID=3446117 RepID=UPI003EBF22FB
MVDVSVENATLHAVDRANRSIELGVVGWDQPADGPSIPIELDTTVTGRVLELAVPDVLVEVSLDGDGYEKLPEYKTVQQLADGEYTVKLSGELTAYIRFDGAATLRRRAGGTAELTFEHPTAVTLGFWTMVDYPEHTVTVPPTPTGVATALTHLSSAHIRMTPDRTLPGWREHPPLVELGDETHVPDAVREATPETGIELVVPDALAPLFPATPLVHYLGATVRVDPGRERPLLRAPAVDIAHEFSALPDFQFEAADLFERVFYLDCIIRAAGPDSQGDLVELDLLAAIDTDLTATYDASVAERLAHALDPQVAALDDRLPSRNYVLFAEPAAEHVPVLPFAMSYLGRVYLPSAADTLDLTRERRRGIVGWLGEGSHPDAFEARPRAYQHRLEHLAAGDSDTSILVVGSADRAAAVQAVADRYEATVDETAATVSRIVGPTRVALRDALETRTDLVHFLGDASDGFHCADGTLAVGDLFVSKARTVVLDGPTDAGLAADLVERGSVAGVVRTDERTAVPTTLVELLSKGYGVDLATRIAHEFGDGETFRVVGDGTNALPEDDNVSSIPLTVTANGDATFEVVGEPGGAIAGLVWHPDVEGVSQRLLSGRRPFTVSAMDLTAILRDPDYLVISDGEPSWSGDLAPFYPVV